MNPTPDERFTELAVQVTSGKATAEEKADLDGILAGDPARRREFAEWEQFAKVVRTIGEDIAVLDAEPVPVPLKLDQEIRAILAKRFGAVPKEAAAPQKPRVLAAKEMEVLLLKILSDRPMDGFHLSSCLRKAGIAPAEGGEGAWYGLLAQLESKGLLEGQWRPSGGRMSKTYHVTDKGDRRLAGIAAGMGSLDQLTQAVLGFDAAG